MKILKFPELRQAYSWDCGASAMQSVLVYYGFDVREQLIMQLAGTTRGGTLVTGMEKIAGAYGLNFKAGKMTIDEIKKYIDKGIPTILLVQAWAEKSKVNWEKDWSDGHYVIAIGYDSKKLFFEDPYSVSRTYLAYEEFENRWHDVTKDGKKHINWGMAVFGKKASYDLSKTKHMD